MGMFARRGCKSRLPEIRNENQHHLPIKSRIVRKSAHGSKGMNRFGILGKNAFVTTNLNRASQRECETLVGISFRPDQSRPEGVTCCRSPPLPFRKGCP